jgi:hypothetical protein
MTRTAAADPVSLLAPVRAAFRAIAEAIVPESRQLDDRAWTEMENVIEAALAARPARVRRQLTAFIRLVSLLTLLRFGRPVRSVSIEKRGRLLDALQRSRMQLLRRGLWGLRTLVLMGYYARKEAAAEIGYRATARGWKADR